MSRKRCRRVTSSPLVGAGGCQFRRRRLFAIICARIYHICMPDILWYIFLAANFVTLWLPGSNPAFSREGFFMHVRLYFYVWLCFYHQRCSNKHLKSNQINQIKLDCESILIQMSHNWPTCMSLYGISKANDLSFSTAQFRSLLSEPDFEDIQWDR